MYLRDLLFIFIFFHYKNLKCIYHENYLQIACSLVSCKVCKSGRKRGTPFFTVHPNPKDGEIYTKINCLDAMNIRIYNINIVFTIINKQDLFPA